MTDFTEIVFCDGTCGLSPTDHARQHPDPLIVLRDQLAATIGDAIVLRSSPRHIADAVLADIAAHPVLTIRHYAPTQDAYDAACRALGQHRATAAILAGRLAVHARCDVHPATVPADGCPHCGDRTVIVAYAQGNSLLPNLGSNPASSDRRHDRGQARRH